MQDISLLILYSVISIAIIYKIVVHQSAVEGLWAGSKGCVHWPAPPSTHGPV